MNDPAFLFYSSDFLTGTMLFTDEQVGRYIRTLCYIHQHGHISTEELKLLCKDDNLVIKKFIKDEDNLYYNLRLEKEIERRTKYIEKQRENGLKGGRPKTQIKPKLNPDNTISFIEIRNIKDINILINNNIEEIKKYNKERKNNVDAERFYNFYESKGWMIGKNKMKDWKACIRTWEQKQDGQPLPEWYGKNIKKESMTKEEEQELQEMIKEFE